MRIPMVSALSLSLALCRNGAHREHDGRSGHRGHPAPIRLDERASRAMDGGASFPPNGRDRACTDDADCRERGRTGRCFNAGLSAQYTQAFQCEEGARWRAAHPIGTCVWDECARDESCQEGTRCAALEMVPFPQRVCTAAACTHDHECRRASGGHCLNYFSAGRCTRGGWACSYPSDPCIPRDAHRLCAQRAGVTTYCAPQGERFACIEQPVVAP